MSRWNLAWLLGITTAALVGFSLTCSVPTRANSLQRKHDNLRLLVDVLDEVQQKYVKELDDDKMRDLVENMISGGLQRLDPHSDFVSADEFKQFQKASKGKFGGIGIRINVDPRSGQVIVESPMVGTPAYEAGIMAGDLILKIDGHATENMPLKKVVEMIQGEPGTKVTLGVLHEGAKTPVDIDITRAEINIDSVLGDQRGDDKEWDFWIDAEAKIAYVRVVGFTETTVAELTKVVDSLQKANMKGLVLDLRGNPGGLLRSAVEVSSMFLEEGKNVVTTKGRSNDSKEVFNARRSPVAAPANPYPIAILLNRYSASASEIVAAALQDHLRAVVIGERSYGKGSVQNVIAMEGGATALKLTTASYWRPSGKNIHRFPDSKEEEEWGVKPNPGFEMKLSDEERINYFKWRRYRDIVRRNGEGPKPADEEKLKDFRDRVLDKALEHLRGELKKQQGASRPQPSAPVAVRDAMRFIPGETRETRISQRRQSPIPVTRER
ncbi:MAG: S41 family peptidase [Gemmataceae bacterium]|nr:S41 family peptidase [Gemmataceae bacterium]